jgi:hypothetical protein
MQLLLYIFLWLVIHDYRFAVAYGYANEKFGLTDVMILLFDLLLITDIFVKFYWGYMELGNKVMALNLIREHRLRQKTFYANVIASIPVNWVPLILGVRY